MPLPLIKPPLINRRKVISLERLQSVITTAVRRCDPSCEPFVGVFVERTVPISHVDANWDIRGIKFGKADRDKCDEAISIIVEHLQQEFTLTEEHQSALDSTPAYRSPLDILVLWMNRAIKLTIDRRRDAEARLFL